VTLIIALLTALVPAQAPPLPQPEPFLREVRRHLERDQTGQKNYMYIETRREMKLDKSGRALNESVKVFESYPGLPGEGRWDRLISEDGKPVPPDELAKRDREREQKALEYARRLATEPRKVHDETEREIAKDRRETDRIVADIFTVFDIRLVRREPIDGHDTILLSLTPRPDSSPETRDGRIMKHFTAKAWVSESDYELVRVEIEAMDTVSIGWGLLARVHKGSHASFQRRKVNGEAWLPASVSYTASARIALFKMMRVGGGSEYSGYRKFTVGTSTTYTPK